MNIFILQWNSLKTRITLLTLAIFLVSMWALAFSVTRMLHADMQRMLGEQEFSTVSLMAQDVNEELTRRVQALEDVAHRVSPAILGNPVALQRLLEEHVIMQSLFNGGTYVTDMNGTTIAGLPVSANRVGINYMDRDYIAAAIQDGKRPIGRPVISKSLNVPIIGIAQPIRDSQGKVIGALAGVINLVEHNFLDKITYSRYGKTGGYLLMDPQSHLFVTATDKSRIMQPLPAPGLNAMHDRYMQGFNGFGVAVNSRGIEVLSAAQRVPAAGWFMAVVLPSEEAFAVVDAVHRNVLLTALLLSLLASALTWWILRRELMPLLRTADTLAAQAQSGLPPQVLPLTRQVETDQLIGGFNRLLETLAQREQAMHENETRYREMFESNPQPMWVYDLETLAFLTVNDATIAHYGYSGEEFLVMTILDIRPAEELPRLWGHLEQGAPGLGKVALWQHCRKDGSIIVVETHSHSLLFDGHPARAVLAHDVTATKAAEQALRESRDLTDAIVENVPLMIFLKEATQLRFMVFNRAGEELVGYDRRDMLGKNDLDLFPLDQATNFMTTDRAVLNGDAGVYDIPEEVIQTANKGQRVLHTRKVCIRGSDGHAKYLLGISEDITDRKAAEQRIENLAFYDPLTNLPNRALLLNRLQHALVAAVRHQRQGALLLIDLDNFKTINDTLGHEQGDLLIQQAAKRLSFWIFIYRMAIPSRSSTPSSNWSPG